MARIGRMLAPWVLVAVMAALAFGTISNQVRINAASTKLRAQAEAGAQGLARQCRLLPISKKLYADGVARHKITPQEFGLIVSTGHQYCPGR